MHAVLPATASFCVQRPVWMLLPMCNNQLFGRQQGGACREQPGHVDHIVGHQHPLQVALQELRQGHTQPATACAKKTCTKFQLGLLAAFTA